MHRLVPPLQGLETNRHRHPGRRYTLPQADLSRPLQGTPPQRRKTVFRSPCRKSQPGQIKPGQRRDDSVPQDEPHVHSVRIAFALKCGTRWFPRTFPITPAARVIQPCARTFPSPRVNRIGSAGPCMPSCRRCLDFPVYAPDPFIRPARFRPRCKICDSRLGEWMGTILAVERQMNDKNAHPAGMRT